MDRTFDAIADLVSLRNRETNRIRRNALTDAIDHLIERANARYKPNRSTSCSSLQKSTARYRGIVS